MFNHLTGAVDPSVMAYWREHYDIAYLLSKASATTKRHLQEKTHLIMGDVDTFYLEGCARRLQQALADLDIAADVKFLPGKSLRCP